MIKGLMDKEEQIFRKRILELSQVSYQRNVPTHTDFLNLNEQTIFLTMGQAITGSHLVVTGGYELAERKIVCFLPYYAENFDDIPISCIRITPVNQKFAQQLNHRDYLGALMNLGIERSKIGDILIDESQCFLLCMEDMAEYIARELTFVKHTKIDCAITDLKEFEYTPKFESVSGSVASVRLDTVVALAFRISRGKAVDCIEAERAFINGRLCISNHVALKPADVISVRGLGKFRFRGVQNETKKGRLFVTVDKYC